MKGSGLNFTKFQKSMNPILRKHLAAAMNTDGSFKTSGSFIQLNPLVSYRAADGTIKTVRASTFGPLKPVGNAPSPSKLVGAAPPPPAYMVPVATGKTLAVGAYSLPIYEVTPGDPTDLNSGNAVDLSDLPLIIGGDMDARNAADGDQITYGDCYKFAPLKAIDAVCPTVKTGMVRKVVAKDGSVTFDVLLPSLTLGKALLIHLSPFVSGADIQHESQAAIAIIIKALCYQRYLYNFGTSYGSLQDYSYNASSFGNPADTLMQFGFTVNYYYPSYTPSLAAIMAAFAAKLPVVIATNSNPGFGVPAAHAEGLRAIIPTSNPQDPLMVFEQPWGVQYRTTLLFSQWSQAASFFAVAITWPFGAPKTLSADEDGDGTVGSLDQAIVAAHWQKLLPDGTKADSLALTDEANQWQMNVNTPFPIG